MRKKLIGVVVSDKADKTVVVLVNRRKKDNLCGKLISRSKKYHVHDEENIHKKGDKVTIEETKPKSKLKRWKIL